MVGDLDVRDHILMRGDGGRAKIRQTVSDRVLDLDPTNVAMGLRMTFRDVAIRGGRVTDALDDGGGILASNDERVMLRNVVVAGHRVEGFGGEGGGIYAYQARLTIVRSVIRGNFAGDTGGGLDAEEAPGAAEQRRPDQDPRAQAGQPSRRLRDEEIRTEARPTGRPARRETGPRRL